jgi:hypothetical protein
MQVNIKPKSDPRSDPTLPKKLRGPAGYILSDKTRQLIGLVVTSMSVQGHERRFGHTSGISGVRLTADVEDEL